jgi:hypothetical protein
VALIGRVFVVARLSIEELGWSGGERRCDVELCVEGVRRIVLDL